jgi:hypothetical protein
MLAHLAVKLLPQSSIPCLLLWLLLLAGACIAWCCSGSRASVSADPHLQRSNAGLLLRKACMWLCGPSVAKGGCCKSKHTLPESSVLLHCSLAVGAVQAGNKKQDSATGVTEPWFIPAEEALYDALEQVRRLNA